MGVDLIGLMKYAITAVIAIIGAYFAMQKELALAKQRIASLESRTEAHSKKIDNILSGVNDIKEMLAEMRTELKYKEDKK